MDWVNFFKPDKRKWAFVAFLALLVIILFVSKFWLVSISSQTEYLKKYDQLADNIDFILSILLPLNVFSPFCWYLLASILEWIGEKITD